MKLEMKLCKQLAVYLYEKAAKQGNVHSQNKLGECYENGEGVPQDFEKATFWYQKAAEQGYADAQYNLGGCYYCGMGVPKDYEKAVFLYQKAADQGNAKAQNALGTCFFHEQGVPQDTWKATFWYQKAAEQGYADAQYNLGGCYYYGMGVPQDYEKAVFWYQKAAKQGDVGAQYDLGDCYRYGQGALQDSEKAMFWYQKAAEQGDADVQADVQKKLGDWYRYGGQGVLQDSEKAMFWYQKAAEQGDADVQADVQKKLGDWYRYGGQGVLQDSEKAVFWYQKAAEQGDADAQKKLGDWYFAGGQGVPEDSEKAVFWYQKAAEQGNADAQKELGNCYRYRQGVPQDDEKAVFWYQKAAEQGDADVHVQFYLGNCYYYGRGVPQDDEKAAFWYQKAAEQGNGNAQNALGDCYRYGQGVPQDDEKAVFWYQKAAEQGDVDVHVQYYLANCYYYGRVVPQDYEKAVSWYRKSAENGYTKAQKQVEKLMKEIDTEEATSSENSTISNGKNNENVVSESDTNSIKQLNNLIGLQSVKKQVNSIINMIKIDKRLEAQGGTPPKGRSLHMVFSGNPGTGKTTVARLIGEIYHQLGVLSKGQLVEVSRSDIVAGYIGQTATKMKEKIEEAKGGVLFIDEAYSLAEGGENDFGHEAITELTKDMEDAREDLVVIAAGYPDRMKGFLNDNVGLASRFGQIIKFDDYSPDELLEIFKKNIDETKLPITDDALNYCYEYFKRMSGTSNFANGRFIREFFNSCYSKMANRIAQTGDELQLIIDDVKVEGFDLEKDISYEEYLKELDSLIGLESVKEEVREVVAQVASERKKAELGLPSNKSFSHHLVFTGNPGTGKTTVARIIGKIYKSIGLLSNGNFVEVGYDDLVAGYVGQTGLKTGEKIKEAMGGILFIDEAYQLTPHGDNDFGSEAITKLLKEMEDHRDDFVVIAAGYPDLMDNFLKSNPGLKSRFKTVINFPDYSADELIEIFMKICRDNKMVIEKGAEKYVEEYFTYQCDHKNKEFANGRLSRNYYEIVVKKQETRINRNIKNPTREDYLLLKEEDFASANQNLGEISSKGKTTPIGF